MQFDNDALLSDDQAITATAASTNVFTVHPSGGDHGKCVPGAKLAIRVTETFATLTSLTIALETDDNSGFSSAKTLHSTGAITLAGGGLAAGSVYDVTIPVGCEEYLRLNYTVGGSNATAGKITAGLVFETQTN